MGVQAPRHVFTRRPIKVTFDNEQIADMSTDIYVDDLVANFQRFELGN